jgi:hypothetical protein
MYTGACAVGELMIPSMSRKDFSVRRAFLVRYDAQDRVAYRRNRLSDSFSLLYIPPLTKQLMSMPVRFV